MSDNVMVNAAITMVKGLLKKVDSNDRMKKRLKELDAQKSDIEAEIFMLEKRVETEAPAVAATMAMIKTVCEAAGAEMEDVIQAVRVPDDSPATKPLPSSPTCHGVLPPKETTPPIPPPACYSSPPPRTQRHKSLAMAFSQAVQTTTEREPKKPEVCYEPKKEGELARLPPLNVIPRKIFVVIQNEKYGKGETTFKSLHDNSDYWGQMKTMHQHWTWGNMLAKILGMCYNENTEWMKTEIGEVIPEELKCVVKKGDKYEIKSYDIDKVRPRYLGH